MLFFREKKVIQNCPLTIKFFPETTQKWICWLKTKFWTMAIKNNWKDYIALIFVVVVVVVVVAVVVVVDPKWLVNHLGSKVFIFKKRALSISLAFNCNDFPAKFLPKDFLASIFLLKRTINFWINKAYLSGKTLS